MIPEHLRPIPEPPPTEGPRYDDEDEGCRATHRLDTLPHGLALDVPDAAIVRAVVPGTHEIRWEIHASNLPRHVSGALVVNVGPLEYDEPPIAELDVAQRALRLAGLMS